MSELTDKQIILIAKDTWPYHKPPQDAVKFARAVIAAHEAARYADVDVTDQAASENPFDIIEAVSSSMPSPLK